MARRKRMTELFHEYDAEGVQEFLKSDQGVLIDTLTPEHYARKHIPGAQNACVYEVVFLDTMHEVVPDKTTPVVLYGAGVHSRDSLVAADKLERDGYDDIGIFSGGLEEWGEASLDFEGSAPEVVDPPHPLLSLEERPYTVVSAESAIHWTGRNNNGSHEGTVDLKDGRLEVADSMSGVFTLDMKSLRNRDLAGDPLQPVLENHLASDDFLFTKMFPQAEFVISDIAENEDAPATMPNHTIRGVLELRGVKREISFPAHIRNLDDGRIALLANFDFDRTEWGIIYGSARFFQYLGYHVVYDLISVDIRLVLE